MSTYTYYAPSCSLFGYNCLEKIADEIKGRNWHKGLLITDSDLVELGIAKKVSDVLKRADIPCEVFDGVKPNPTKTVIYSGLEIQKNKKCDFLISVGGGSAHDCAKAIAVLATNGGQIEDYRGLHKSREKALPIIAVNTTAGTASECTHTYVVADEELNVKFGIRDKNVLATVAVDDHSLMMRLPKGLTAGTGMDALTHAVEAYTAKRAFVLTKAFSEVAVRMIYESLSQAVFEGSEDAREKMATGQYLAGLAMGNAGCGLVHAMSHQLSAVYNLPHGLSNAVLFPSVLRFNAEKCRSAMEQYAVLGRLLFPYEVKDQDDLTTSQIFIDKIQALSEAIGTACSLRSLGVQKKDLSMLAEKAAMDGNLKNNPIGASKEEIEQIYEDLF